jgi:glycosyltransferase involved in cell wall biosynthesis
LPKRGAGWWVNLESGELADALRAATRLAPEELAARGEAGRSWMIADFGWDSIAKRFTDVYLDILRRK